MFRRRNQELSDELESHMRLAVEDRIKQGMTRREAEAKVRQEFGNEDLVKDVTRDAWGWTSLARLKQDTAFALRMLRRNPGFTAAAVLTLALGIGANTAIFSVVNGLLIRSLPVKDVKSLVWITNSDGTGGPSSVTSRAFTFRDFRQYNTSFTDMAGYNAFYQYFPYNLTGSGEPERLSGLDVTETFFPLLGVEPVMGRGFLHEETVRGGRRVILLAHSFWKARFNGRRDITGQTLSLNGEPHTVIGVMPDSFDFGSIFIPGAKADFFRPYYVDEVTNRDGNEFAIIGRLKRGVTIGSAQAEMTALAEELVKKAGPRGGRFGAHLKPLEQYVTGALRRPLMVLAGAVGFVLLIACANLSNLLLARASVRRKELALRVALGASRFRLVRQMLTESLLLAIGGAAVGLPLAFAGTRMLAGLQRTAIPMLGQIQIDLRVFLFTLAISVVTGILFGLLPAIDASRSQVADALKENTAGAGGAIHRNWTRSVLIVSEIALSLILLGGAGLMTRSFLRLIDTDLGFRPEHVAVMRVDPGPRIGKAPVLYAFLDRVTAAARAIPGVESAGITDAMPLDRDRSWDANLLERAQIPNTWLGAFVRVVGPGYFSTMQIPLIDGRTFDARDIEGGQRTVILNESLATHLLPGQKAVGQTVLAGGKRLVIGVVKDVRHSALDQGAGNEFYIPYAQGGIEGADLVVRTRLEPQALASAIRKTIWSFAPDLPLAEIRTADQLVDTASSPRRFTMLLLAIFAGMALVLAAVGIYGVIAYSVGQRTREMGIRMALGATAARLELQVIREALVLSGIGAVMGLIGLFAVSRFIASLLYGTSAVDPAVFGGATAVLVGVALWAAWIPARQAARIDPVSALRFE